MSRIVSDFGDRLTAALRLDLPYLDRPVSAPFPAPGTPAAVLILFSLDLPEPSLLLIRRADTVDSHKGQFAFPGGRIEAEDRSSREAALRETFEEVGIFPDCVRVLGELPKLWTPSGFWVEPQVGILTRSQAEIKLTLSPEETAEAFWVPLSVFGRPGVYHLEAYTLSDTSFPIHVYEIEGRRIWGATGAMIKNLLDRLQSSQALS